MAGKYSCLLIAHYAAVMHREIKCASVLEGALDNLAYITNILKVGIWDSNSETVLVYWMN